MVWRQFAWKQQDSSSGSCRVKPMAVDALEVVVDFAAVVASAAEASSRVCPGGGIGCSRQGAEELLASN